MTFLLLLLESVSCYATSTATENVSIPYPKVVSTIYNQLQSCVAQNPNLLQYGIKIEPTSFGNDTIIHVTGYDFSGSEEGELGMIAISKEKGQTLINISQESGILWVRLRLAERVNYWLNGYQGCL